MGSRLRPHFSPLVQESFLEEEMPQSEKGTAAGQKGLTERVWFSEPNGGEQLPCPRLGGMGQKGHLSPGDPTLP